MALAGRLSEFYKTAVMREGILSWYPFAFGAEALDLSKGTLTALLTKHVNKVHVGSPEPHRTYDYIVVIDPEELTTETLGEYGQHLNTTGRLLLAYENPFALCYWAGHTAPNTGRPYDTLFARGKAPLPSKAELLRRLTKAGLRILRWYYPLADHWLTTEVYSESYLPNEFLNQRFVPHLNADVGLQFDYRSLYREVICGGAFEFLCGAYLVEATRSPSIEPCTVDYAAVTAYREPQKRFATLLCNDGKAYKKPLSAEGVATVNRIASNHHELNALGVNALICQVENDQLVMPRLDEPTLYDHMAKTLADDAEGSSKVAALFDQNREDIYMAGKSGTCFWELVPANCFYNEHTGALTYFDQEYASFGVSPEIAVARSISGLKYSRAFDTNPRAQDLFEELVRKYELQGGHDYMDELAKMNTYLEVFGIEHQTMQRISRENATLLQKDTCSSPSTDHSPSSGGTTKSK